MRQAAASVTLFLLTMGLMVPPADAAVWNLTAMTPDRGPWGTVVRLRGRNFRTGAVKVYYDGKPVKPLRVTHVLIEVRVPEGVRSGWFEVEQDGRRMLAPKRFVVRNETVVKDMIPPKGLAGSWVTIRGRFMRNAAAFYFNHVRLKVRIRSDSEAEVFIPRGARTGYLEYMTLGRRVRTRLRYTVVPSPHLRDFSPDSAWIGDRVVLKGSRICRHPVVHVSGRDAEIIRASASRIEVRLPDGLATGEALVEVLCYGRAFPFPVKLRVQPRYAVIERILPNPAAPGEWVELQGRNFSPSDRFWIGSVPVKEKKFVKPSSIRIRVPSSARSGMIHFESHGRRFPSDLVLRVIIPPVVKSVNPQKAWYGEWISIRGTGFCPRPSVLIDGRRTRVRIQVPGSQIMAQIPRKARRGIIKLLCGRFSASTSITIAPPSVEVTAVVPAGGIPGQVVEIRGRNFPPDAVVYVGHRRVKLLSVTPGSIRFRVMSASEKGKISIKAYGRRWTSSLRFDARAPEPVLLRAPSTVQAGSVIALSGKELCLHPKVTAYSGRKRIYLRVVRSDSRNVTAVVPLRIPKGTTSIDRIAVRCGRKSASLKTSVRILPPSGVVSYMDPISGPPGTWITVRGTGIPERARFYLGRWQARSRRKGSGEVLVRVPVKAQGQLPLRIKAPGSGRAVDTGLSFRVVFPKPVIIGVSRDAGWTGDVLVVKGRDFCEAPRVRIGGVSAMVRKAGPEFISVVIPAHPKRGPVEVICRGGTAKGPVFTPIPPYATVTGVNPVYACPGDRVTITGDNLNEGVVFYLGKKRVRPETVSAHRSVIVIPKGTRSSDLKVESFGRRASTGFAIIIKTRVCKKRSRKR